VTTRHRGEQPRRDELTFWVGVEVTEVDDVGTATRGLELGKRRDGERRGQLASQVAKVGMLERSVGPEEILLQAPDRGALPGDEAAGSCRRGARRPPLQRSP
jgi:hypothetical protein